MEKREVRIEKTFAISVKRRVVFTNWSFNIVGKKKKKDLIKPGIGRERW